MKTNKKALVEELTTSLAPYIRSTADAEPRLPKSLEKTVQRLAEQILQLRAKHQKKASQVAPKVARQALSDELAGLLDSPLHEVGDEPIPPEKVAQVSQKAPNQRASQTGKLRGKTDGDGTGRGPDPQAPKEEPGTKPEKRSGAPRRRFVPSKAPEA
jgi:hypothetical protein